MNELRNIASGLLALVALVSTTAVPAAQTNATVTGQATPVELQILDPAFAPLTGLSVAVDGLHRNPAGVGRYVLSVNGPKVVIQVHLPDRGALAVLLEIPLERGKFVYLEVCLDPTTGEVKDVFQKATRASAAGRERYAGQIGRGQATANPGQTASGTPANDDCASALPIGDGVTPFSTLGASTDGPDHPGACMFGNGETVNDIWYIYTASCTGNLTVSTCDDADYDSDLVIYDGVDCGNLLGTLLGCNDDATGCGGLTSELTVPVVAGNEYLLRVGGYGSFGDDSMGTGNLTVSCAAGGGPSNDDCADAENIDCNSTATVDTSLYTTDPGDPPVSCFFGGAQQGFGSAWFTFVASDTSAFLSTSPSAGGDSQLTVFDGTCGAFTELGCSEDEGVGLLSELTVTGLSVGTTYYVQLTCFSVATQGEYTLELVCPAPGGPIGRCCLPDGTCFEGVTEDDCFVVLGGNDWLEGATCTTDPCPQPPPNDDCADAIDLGQLTLAGLTVLVDNTGATTDGPGDCGVFSGPFNNVWYTFSGSGRQTRVTTCSVAGTTNPDTKVSVFCGDCIDRICVGGNDDHATPCGNGVFLSTFDFCSELGQLYYVTVGDFSATSGSGPIQLAIRTNQVPCNTPPDCFVAPQGACCLPDGSCTETTEADCGAQGGDYLGDGTTCDVGSEAVDDGGFEAGPFGGTWTEFSSTFGTPICDIASCGTGGGAPPYEGSFWCWFGGIGGLVESGFVEQTVTIPAGADTLTFYLDIPASSGNGADFMNVVVDGGVVFSVLEGDPTYGTPGDWVQVTVDISAFADGGAHTLRFESTTFGNLGVTNFFVDAVSIATGATQCEQCFVIDFETEDDFVTPLVNGQDISTPPEFGNLLAISASTASEGPAIFDTDPAGPNASTNNDDDLLVDLGNALIFQEIPGQAVPGLFEDPDDSSAGGTFFFDFSLPVEVRSVVLADIDLYPLPQDAYVTLVDGNFNTRTYHCPSGFTEDVTIDGGTGWRKLDLTTLAPQPGFVSTATASQDPGFDPEDVVRLEVALTSSGAVDDIELCF